MGSGEWPEWGVFRSRRVGNFQDLQGGGFSGAEGGEFSGALGWGIFRIWKG
jgi:hypothetical protein